MNRAERRRQGLTNGQIRNRKPFPYDIPIIEDALSFWTKRHDRPVPSFGWTDDRTVELVTDSDFDLQGLPEHSPLLFGAWSFEHQRIIFSESGMDLLRKHPIESLRTVFHELGHCLLNHNHKQPSLDGEEEAERIAIRDLIDFCRPRHLPVRFTVGHFSENWYIQNFPELSEGLRRVLKR